LLPRGEPQNQWAALCAAQKWFPKNRNVWFWCVYTIPLELILSKIPRKNNAPPPFWVAGQKSAKTRRLAGKKFPPLKPFHFLPARRKKWRMS